MLNQSILLNLKIGWKNFQIAFGIALALLALALMPTLIVSTVLQLAAAVVPLFFIYKGLYDIFGASVYGQGSPLYMTLPFSPREVVLGKVLAASIYLFVYNLITLVMIGLSVAIGGNLTELLFFLLKESSVVFLDTVGKQEVGLLSAAAGFYPLLAFLSSMSTVALLFMLLLRFNRNGTGRGNGLAWVLFFGLSFGLNAVVNQLSPLLLDRGITVLLASEISAIALYTGLSALFMHICIRTLKYDYNV